ncbi:MAG: hypothetical protein ABI896_04870 [Actinomycetota bacterium]
MSRIRLAIVLLLVGSAGAASFLSSTEAASQRRPPYSHRITVVSGRLVDHWTVTDAAPCAATGEGTMTLEFHLVKTKLVLLVLDPYHNGEPNNTLGSWVVGIPGPFGGLRDIPAQPATGTITFVDLTTQNPPDPYTGPCTPLDKSGCGTFPLPRAAKANLQGYNRRFLKADFYGASFAPRRGGCLVGRSELFSERLAGGTPLRGELLMRMPSKRTVAHRRTLVVVGSTHKLTTSTDCSSGTGCSDDVTRRVSVTFKHL